MSALFCLCCAVCGLSNAWNDALYCGYSSDDELSGWTTSVWGAK